MDSRSPSVAAAPNKLLNPFLPLLALQVLVSAGRVVLLATQAGGDLEFPVSKLLAIVLSVLTCTALFLAARQARSRQMRKSFVLMGLAVSGNLVGNLLYLVYGL